MKIKVRTNSIKLCPVIGFGYWKDIYRKQTIGIDGVAHNIILPFIRAQFGYLIADKTFNP